MCRKADFLDSFQPASGISLESLENTVFPFASCGGLKYLLGIDGLIPIDGFASPMGPPSS
jgi:hypothetical protein